MKKIFLFLTLTVTMVLMVSINSFAAGVYVDTMVNGSWEDSTRKGDANDTYIGIEAPLGDFKLNLEMLTGNWEEGNANSDFNGYEVKGGYRLLNDRDLQVYLNLTNYYRKFDNSINEEFNGILLGADGVLNLTKKVNLEGSIDFSLSGKYKSDKPADVDANLLNSKVKLNFGLAKNVYGSVGYRYYQFKFNDNDEKIEDKGFTVGLKCTF